MKIICGLKRSLVYVIFTLICYVIFAIACKIFPIPAGITSFATSISTFIYCYLSWDKQTNLFQWHSKIFAWSFCTLASFLSAIFSVRFMPVGLAMGIYMTTPAWAAIIEKVMYPNRFLAVQRQRVACIGCIVGGILIQGYASSVNKEEGNSQVLMMGGMIACVGAITNAIANTIVECAEPGLPPCRWLFIRSTGLFIIFLFNAILTPSILLSPFLTWAKGFTISAILVTLNIFRIKSFEDGDIAVSTVVSIDSLQIPFVFIYGIIFLSEPCNIFVAFGCLAITAGCIVLVLFFSQSVKECEDPELQPLLKKAFITVPSIEYSTTVVPSFMRIASPMNWSPSQDVLTSCYTLPPIWKSADIDYQYRRTQTL